MLRGLYLSATQMIANEKLLDTIGNNVANIDTTGFKKDELQQESFNDVLLSKYNGTEALRTPSFSKVAVTQDNPTDYTLKTDGGYFRVQTDTGVSYNTSVSFSVDKDGYLSTYYLNSDKKKDLNLGDKILGSQGPIYIGDQAYTVNEKGEVQVGGKTVDSLIYQPVGQVIGTMGGGIKATRLVTDFSQGTLIPTGGSLDIAIQGSGFIEINTPFGTRYTRNGSFTLDKDKQLVTSEGYLVQGFKGNITLKSDNITINEFGEIIQDGEIVDKLKLTDFTNQGDLRKIGVGLYSYSDKPQGQQVAFTGQIVQGEVEQSNVGAINEMIRMISVQRDYENGNKLVRAFDETLQKAATELGTVR